MKILKLLAMLCVIATVSVSVTSCNKDDDDDDNGIVGTWRCTEDGDWDEFTFKSNGTFTWTWHEEGYPNEVEKGTYTYDHPTLTLIFEESDEYEKGEKEVFKIKSISSSEFVLVSFDEDEYEDTYKKR